jgi:hypothetical protein
MKTAKPAPARYVRRKAVEPPPRKPKDNRKKKQRPPHPGEAQRIAARRVKAFELRKAGFSYREIARACGVDLRTVYDDVQAEMRELREQTTEAAEAVRELELRRCDEMTKALEPKRQRGDVQAIQALIRVMERRAKLTGADMPTKVQADIRTINPEKVKQVSDDKLQALHDAALLALSLVD